MGLKLCEDCREFNKSEIGKPTYCAKGEGGIRKVKKDRIDIISVVEPRDVAGFPYKLPVRIDEDKLTILDATGAVIVPCIAYRGDLVHIEIQKSAVEYIVSKLNR